MRTKLLVGVIVLALAYIYLAGIASYPLKWEEPRRCLVAMEMIHSGDFIGPRVLGEPYFKKPPLQNWLLSVASLMKIGRVGSVPIRTISLVALAGVGAFLFLLGSNGREPRSDPLPALIFLTLGAVIQSGRTGEIDPLFTFFVVGALACFELGRRRRSPLLQWFVPHLFLAGGILTKVLAPLFFYPPVLYLLLRRRDAIRWSPGAAIAGVAAMVGLVAIWFVPYSKLQASSALVGGWSMEVAVRTLHYGVSGWLRHFATYPFQLVGWLLPWSLALIPIRRAPWRSTIEAWRRDPFLGLCLAVVVWAALVYLFVPEQKGRYLLPVMPFVSVLVAHRVRQAGTRRLASGLLVLGLLYGIAYAGIAERKEARRNTIYVEDARALAASIDPGDTVVCHGSVHLKFSAALTRQLERPLARRAEPGSPAVWITVAGSSPETPGSVARGERHELFRFEGEQAWSLDAAPLFSPTLDDATRTDFEAKLDHARARYEASPEDADAAIWYGRRTAYLGRYLEAIEIYGRALDLNPNDPRLYRHRGHRFISIRRFDAAVQDLEAAAGLIVGRPDEVEPDGLPNARNSPTSTLQSNIWYHLGLAYYLKGDLDNAERSYRQCLEVSANPDMLSATTHWLYMTLRRGGNHAEAERVLEPIHAGMDVIENRSYHRLLLMYKSELDPAELAAELDGAGNLDRATVGYGLANWHRVRGERSLALDHLARVRALGQWAAFGAIAAEADWARLSNRTL